MGSNRRVSQSGNAFGDNALPAGNSRQGYTGHTLDNSAGLTYMKARYYDHNIGRFLSNDPVGFYVDRPVSFNRYSYAGNNPYRYIDPNGEDFLDAYRNPANAMGVSNFAARVATRSEKNPISALGTAVFYGSAALTGYGLHKLSVLMSEELEGEEKTSSENKNEDTKTPSPALEGDPYSPQEVDIRRSERRRKMGVNADPDSKIPDQSPGQDMGGHDARNRTPHDTGERNVNRHEEHSKRPKGGYQSN